MTAKSKTFTFTHAGEDFTIPSFSALPMGALRKTRKLKDETDKVFTIIESAVGVDSPALDALDSMSGEEFEAFLSAWTQGAPLGESSGS